TPPGGRGELGFRRPGLVLNSFSDWQVWFPGLAGAVTAVAELLLAEGRDAALALGSACAFPWALDCAPLLPEMPGVSSLDAGPREEKELRQVVQSWSRPWMITPGILALAFAAKVAPEGTSLLAVPFVAPWFRPQQPGSSSRTPAAELLSFHRPARLLPLDFQSLQPSMAWTPPLWPRSSLLGLLLGRCLASFALKPSPLSFIDLPDLPAASAFKDKGGRQHTGEPVAIPRSVAAVEPNSNWQQPCRPQSGNSIDGDLASKNRRVFGFKSQLVKEADELDRADDAAIFCTQLRSTARCLKPWGAGAAHGKRKRTRSETALNLLGAAVEALGEGERARASELACTMRISSERKPEIHQCQAGWRHAHSPAGSWEAPTAPGSPRGALAATGPFASCQNRVRAAHREQQHQKPLQAYCSACGSADEQLVGRCQTEETPNGKLSPMLSSQQQPALNSTQRTKSWAGADSRLEAGSSRCLPALKPSDIAGPGTSSNSTATQQPDPTDDALRQSSLSPILSRDSLTENARLRRDLHAWPRPLRTAEEDAKEKGKQLAAYEKTGARSGWSSTAAQGRLADVLFRVGLLRQAGQREGCWLQRAHLMHRSSISICVQLTRDA
uniref:TPR_REGION domain-containing protein n=1 Tax=Macrostomum lignano TaxID=282301 RepID=A0A1I8FP11_9PLAT